MRRTGILLLFITLLGPLTFHYSALGMKGVSSLDIEGQALLGYCSVVSADEDYVYAGFGSAVAVIDVQNPAFPEELGRTFVPNCFDGKTAVWNDRFFVPRDIYGLGVFNASDPYNPYHAATYRDPELEENENEYSGGVEVVDGYAFWANGHNGLTILDVSDPSSPPVRVGGYDYNGPQSGCSSGTEPSSPLDFAMSAHVEGNLAYLCTRNTGLYIIDITDKTSPSFIKNIPGGFAIDMAAKGPYGFIANGTFGLKVIDLNTNTAVFSSTTTPNISWFYRSVVVFNNYLYVANATSGVEVFDISNPLKPSKIKNISTSYYSSQLAIKGNYLYIADCLGGLKVYSLENPDSPQYVTTFGQPDQARDVAVLTENIGGQEVPRFAYIAYGKKGLAMVDVSDISNPSNETIQDINSDADKGSTEAVRVNNGMLYAADGPAGLKVFSLTDPMNPQLVWPKSSLPAGFRPVNILDVKVIDNAAFLADSDNTNGGLWILDMNGVGNPGFQPSFIRYKHGIGFARRVFKHRDYVYVASKGSGCSGPDPMNGLHVIRLDSSLKPTGEVISLTRGYEQITDVDAGDVNSKTYVFLTTDGGPINLTTLKTPDSYLHILEHSTSESKLIEVSKTKFESLYFGNFLPAVEVSGTKAYVDHTNTGVYVYDVSDPYNPEKESFNKLTCNNNSYEIHLFAGLVFNARGDSGIYILR